VQENVVANGEMVSMSLPDLTRDSVLSAVREYDAVGREEFLRRYGFRPSKSYFLIWNGHRYDSKAIAGAAHQFAVPDAGALNAADFSGGEATVARVLERLGFNMERPSTEGPALPTMVVGRSYSWDELGQVFQFKPELLGVGGGMIARPALNALLLITHPGGAKSFDYEDRWDGDTLIYTGRGKTGDQQLTAANRDVAENRRRLLVFQAEATRQLRYLGQATCLKTWPARSRGADGNERNVWKFRLGFEGPSPVLKLPNTRKVNAPIRSPRPFSGVEPSEYRLSKGYRPTQEEIMALQEKANRNHFHTLSRLVAALNKASWKHIEEIPAAIDLQATKPDGSGRVIFEVKSLSESNEANQCRAALAQLLEYRFLYGQDADQLCAVFDRPIADRRLAFLEALGIAVVVLEEKGICMCFGQHVRSLSSDEPSPN
jgi:hypothetical protein